MKLHLSDANTATSPLSPLPGNADTLVGANTITCTTRLVLLERTREFFRQTVSFFVFRLTLGNVALLTVSMTLYVC